MARDRNDMNPIGHDDMFALPNKTEAGFFKRSNRT